MKIDRCVLVAVIGLFALTTTAIADPDPEADNPNLQYDPDGVPLSVTKPRPEQLSPDEIAAFRKQQAQAELDRNWLVRGYESELKKNSNSDESSNLYYQISSNRDLAKLAGLPDVGDDNDSSNNQPQPSTQPPVPENRRPAGAAMQSGGAFLKPFITPMSAPTAAGLPNFYSSLGGSPYGSPAGPPAVAKPSRAPAEDPADIDTPGMIAADKNPETLDLSLDVLPGESVEHARDHQDNNTLLTLPMAPDADQLHRAQAVAFAPQGTAPPATAPTSVTPKAVLVNPADAPVPVSQAPVINPERAPIANPYDILDR